MWRFREASFITESALLLIGLIIYLRATRPKSSAGRYAMSVFVALLVVVEAINVYGPPPPNIINSTASTGAQRCHFICANRRRITSSVPRGSFESDGGS